MAAKLGYGIVFTDTTEEVLKVLESGEFHDFCEQYRLECTPWTYQGYTHWAILDVDSLCITHDYMKIDLQKTSGCKPLDDTFNTVVSELFKRANISMLNDVVAECCYNANIDVNISVKPRWYLLYSED